MTVKRFVAPNMRRALDLVREEMGPDAIILSSQRTKEGVEVITSSDSEVPLYGVNQRKEFTKQFDTDVDTPLASDQAWEAQESFKKAASKFAISQHASRESSEKQRKEWDGKRLSREIETARQRMLAAKKEEESLNQRELNSTSEAEPPLAPDFGSPGAAEKQMAELQQDIRQLKAKEMTDQKAQKETHFQSLQDEIADMRMLLEQQMMQLQQQSFGSQIGSIHRSPQASSLHNHLSGLGLSNTLTDSLLSKMGPVKSVSVAWRQALAHLSKVLPADNSDAISQGGVFAFVGPTGVGKTTTIAKLAARYTLQFGLGKVALITTDTYKVGAQDQLRSLGRILNVPVRVVDQEHNLAAVIASLKSYPLVLIDTAGCRHGESIQIKQESMLASCASLKSILVLAANTQSQTLRSCIRGFTSAGLAGCILTKLDECGSLGELLSLLVESRLPVMYTSEGQAIPKDIEKGSSSNLVAKAVSLMKKHQVSEKLAVGLN